MRSVVLLLFSLLPEGSGAAPALQDRLDEVRGQRLAMEKALLESDQKSRATRDQLGRLKSLQSLQIREKALTRQRLATLENYVRELSSRKEEVTHRIETARGSLKRRLARLIHPILSRSERTFRGEEGEAERKVREQMLSGVVVSELKELSGLEADLNDAREIEGRIEQEKQQIQALLQDVSEQESLIEFHRKIRENLTNERHEEQMRQLEEYRRLKLSESEIEKMISGFQDQSKSENDREPRKRMPLIAFPPKSLPWPVLGRVVGAFGAHRDERSGLQVFRKGIEISSGPDKARGSSALPVLAVLEGRVQFSGEIPGKGKVLILEHAHSIYTIYSGLKEILRKNGEWVRSTESIGSLGSEKSLYFEIRARNVAMDPVKWLK
jgi:septal ring factor EnvC (AmiA/AmiB activator)